MKIVEKIFINLLILRFGRLIKVIISVISNFVSVESCGWNFDWASKSIIVIALVIDHFLYLLFGQICGVDGNFVVDWNCCCRCWIFIGNHVEIKDFISIFLDNCLINKSSWTWIDHSITKLFKKSCCDSFVYENIKYLWIVIWSISFDSFHKLTSWTFEFKTFFLERGTSNTISVNDNLLWDLTFIFILPVIKCIPDKLNQNFRSSLASILLDFILSHIFFTDQFLI